MAIPQPQEALLAIRATLDTLAGHDVLLHPDAYAARHEAIGILAAEVLERIEHVIYVYGYHAELQQLAARALQLQERLQRAQTHLLQRCRQSLLHSLTPAVTLQQLCKAYADSLQSSSVQPGLSSANYVDRFIDDLLGIAQEPAETLRLPAGMIGYLPTPVAMLLQLLDTLQLQAEDVFYDIGAGLGRVVFLVTLLSPAQVKGIEIEPAYCHLARQQADSLGLLRLTILNLDARQADYHDGSVFFLYTPCTGEILQTILERLAQVARHRHIRLAAHGPALQQVSQQSWLVQTHQLTSGQDVLGVFMNH